MPAQALCSRRDGEYVAEPRRELRIVRAKALGSYSLSATKVIINYKLIERLIDARLDPLEWARGFKYF